MHDIFSQLWKGSYSVSDMDVTYSRNPFCVVDRTSNANMLQVVGVMPVG
jgi:hypothetical protein